MQVSLEILHTVELLTALAAQEERQGKMYNTDFLKLQLSFRHCYRTIRLFSSQASKSNPVTELLKI